VIIKINIYFVFQLFLDTESLNTHTINQIRQEWIRYFLNIRNQNLYYKCVLLHVHRH